MKGHLLMSAKERRRKSVFDEVVAGRLTLVVASARLGLSYRQCRRSYRRFVAEGDAGLVHRNRGRPSGRGYPKAFRIKVVARYRFRYGLLELGPTLAAEKLAEDGLVVDHETLRRWLLESGDWHKRRKRKVHRQRRERRAHFGELVQMDGSHHHWFGPDHEPSCLMNMVDDATGKTMGLLDEQETTEAAMVLLCRWIERYGVPKALYTDKKSVYITDREPTLEEQLADETPKTAFGKACDKLGIEIIAAHSPQAKGRVERSNGVYQDRLVKELALRRITTLETANRLLLHEFTDSLNAKFAKPALSKHDYHSPLPNGVELSEVFCFEDERTVQNDWCIRHHNRHYQIEKDNTPLPLPKSKVIVRTRLDGSRALIYKGRPLRYHELSRTERARCNQPIRPAPSPRSVPKKKPRPQGPTRTPWRHGVTLMFAETKEPKK